MQRGLIDKKISPKNSLEIRIQGIGAELAVAKTYNVYPDFSEEPRIGGHDLFIYPSRVDVKHRFRLDGDLIVKWFGGRDYQDIDVFYLVVGLMPKYHLIGYIQRDEIINQAHLVDWGHGWMYAMSRQDLIEARVSS